MLGAVTIPCTHLFPPYIRWPVLKGQRWQIFRFGILDLVDHSMIGRWKKPKVSYRPLIPRA